MIAEPFDVIDRLLPYVGKEEVVGEVGAREDEVLPYQDTLSSACR